PTQHSLPGGRYPLPGPDFHRLDRASFAWRTATPSSQWTFTTYSLPVSRRTHFRSGLHPPCLRFAVAVAGHHARLGTRLLVRLCRGRHRRRLNSMRLQGATPTPPGIRVTYLGGSIGLGLQGRAFGCWLRHQWFGPLVTADRGF